MWRILPGILLEDFSGHFFAHKNVGPATAQNLVVKFDGEICGGVLVENASDDFPSKRSSKISFQTWPEVRHQFRRKLRQLHSGNRWCLKMRRKNPATKSAKKSGGPKRKIREKAVLPKTDPISGQHPDFFRFHPSKVWVCRGVTDHTSP